MIWRAGLLLLAAQGASFVVIDGAGATVSSFAPRTYSDEDDLWRWTYLVEGDRFIERTTVETRGEPRHTDEVLLQGLVSADDPATSRSSPRPMIANVRSWRRAALEMWVAADALDPPRP